MKAAHIGTVSPPASPSNPIYHVPLTLTYQQVSTEGNRLMAQGGAQVEAMILDSNDYVVIARVPYTQRKVDLAPLLPTGVSVVQWRQIGHCGDLSAPSPPVKVTIDHSVPLAPIAPTVSEDCGCA